MYRFRQIPKYSDEKLAEIYAVPHRHSEWPDHVHRVDVTIQLGKDLGFGGLVADLSCGDATIARALSAAPILGDFAPGYPIQGFIEETIDRIPKVDTFILSETLEHLDDPEMVLGLIRDKSRYLLMSTPIHEEGQLDDNFQHYWVYDREAVELMLEETGWSVLKYTEAFNGRGYRFGIFGCE